jgi:hypothetical protein
MTYIIHCLKFVLNDTEHTYLFNREDFSNGILSTDTFNSISQYIADLTNSPITSTLNQELDVNHVMVALNNYGLPISYSLATGFTNLDTGWYNQPYTQSNDPDLETPHDKS